MLTGPSLYHSTIINAPPDFVYMVLLLNISIRIQLHTVLNLHKLRILKKLAYIKFAQNSAIRLWDSPSPKNKILQAHGPPKMQQILNLPDLRL